MAYRVHHDDTRISIRLEGVNVFVLERESDGYWALYPVQSDVRGALIDRCQHANDLIGRVTQGLICAGHLAKVDAGFVVPVPVEAGDFYVSGSGYLCCRTPFRMVLSDTPVTTYGIEARSQIRAATLDERRAAGLDIGDATRSAVLLTP